MGRVPFLLGKSWSWREREKLVLDECSVVVDFITMKL